MTADIVKAKIYFPNLNGLRAVSALMVIVCHIELHKVDFHIRRIPGLNLLNFGKVGVTIFFSLSGFLITYLLLEEKKAFSVIDFKGFYLRRLLRILPLYLLVVFVGFFIYPGGNKSAFWLSLLFLPNLAFSLKMLPAIFDPIWSIGTEEQFYIFFPHFFRQKNLKLIYQSLWLFILAIWIIETFVLPLLTKFHVINVIHQLLYYCRFDNMMIGALVALVYFNTSNTDFNFKFQKVFNAIFKKITQIIIYIMFMIYLVLYLNYNIPHGDVLISVLASLIIVNLCEAGTSVLSLQNRFLRYLGKISYGIYLLHKFALFLVLYLIEKYFAASNLAIQNTLIYGATIMTAIALASISFYCYETPFLKIKKRIQKISQ